MPQSYTLKFKKKIVRLHEEEGHTYKNITAEYSIFKASISKWCREFSKECQATTYHDAHDRLRARLMTRNSRCRPVFLLQTNERHPVFRFWLTLIESARLNVIQEFSSIP